MTRKRKVVKSGPQSQSHVAHKKQHQESLESVIPGRAGVFGTGECAQLGLGEERIERKFGTLVGRDTALFDASVKSVASGGLHNAVIVSDGRVFSWGCNDEKALGRSGDEWTSGLVEGLPTDVIKVCCGDSHTIVLCRNGAVYYWGAYRDESGPLNRPLDTPQLMSFAQSIRKPTAIDIASGSHHSIILMQNGDIYEWGHIRLGQKLFRHRRKALLVPRLVNLRRFGKVQKVFAGGYQSFALTRDDRVFVWGMNQYGQGGVGALDKIHTPREISTLRHEGTKKIAGGLHHSLALTSSGKVFSFGRNNYGELGLGNLDEKREPTKIDSLMNIEDIAAGTTHSVAVDREGCAFSCGFGTMLQLGNGESEDRLEFQPVLGSMMATYTASAASAGSQHTLLLVKEGRT